MPFLGLSKVRTLQAQAEEELSVAEEQIKRLKAGKKQVDVANAFAEARAAKLADELAQLRAEPGQGAGAADAQHEQHMKDVAASEALAEQCKSLQGQVPEAIPPPAECHARCWLVACACIRPPPHFLIDWQMTFIAQVPLVEGQETTCRCVLRLV